MFLIDSNLWVSYFLDYDSNHEKAIQLLRFLDWRWIIYVTNWIIHEVSNILVKKHSKKQSDYFLNYVIYNRDIQIINEDIRQSYELFKTLSIKISFTDISIINTALEDWISLISLDEQMMKIYKKLKNK